MQEFDDYISPEIKKPTFDLSRFSKPKSKANSERSSLIEMFVTKLNNSRMAGGYKPYSPEFIATKMSHVETQDLHAFYKKLDQSKSFGGLWHYYCMPKKK
jgi:hypothetical protein